MPTREQGSLLPLNIADKAFFFQLQFGVLYQSHKFQFPESEAVNKTPGSFY